MRSSVFLSCLFIPVRRLGSCASCAVSCSSSCARSAEIRVVGGWVDGCEAGRRGAAWHNVAVVPICGLPWTCPNSLEPVLGPGGRPSFRFDSGPGPLIRGSSRRLRRPQCLLRSVAGDRNNGQAASQGSRRCTMWYSKRQYTKISRSKVYYLMM